MKSSAIRRLFLDFWKNLGHTEVESASLVPVDDPTLLFTNAGMVQFKETFIGNVKRDYSRATSSQRCVRAGGKHNDLEEVGYTKRHQTMFEMLGNFSFGDYFKDDAINWAWKFVTNELNLDKNRVFVSVYKDDDEAEKIWKNLGIQSDRIFRFGDKDNFWSMGETGPCGPCSEIFYDLGPEAGNGPEDVMGGEGDRFMEFWNLVFMQYHQRADGTRVPLPKPSIDTGAGLERISLIMQGKFSNYETDLFVPLIERVKSQIGETSLSQDQQRIACQVISDHARTSAFLVADGIMPANVGRGYVLRRIMRRAIRYCYQLGIRDPFLHELAPMVIEMMQEAHPIFDGKAQFVRDALRLEEKNFLRTVSKGLDLLDGEIATLKSENKTNLSGAVTFKLYDTFGFPRDLTEVILRDHQLQTSTQEFEDLMTEQRDRARAAQKFGIEDNWDFEVINEGAGDVFVGYSTLSTQCNILKAAQSEEGDRAKLVLAETPFYAESGGQVGDKGWITSPSMKLEVFDTRKEEGEIVHHCRVVEGNLDFSKPVLASVDERSRYLTRKNHTAVHLLQAILREKFGEQIQQAGSYVDQERFRFDFTLNRGISSKEISEIETEIFEKINRGNPVVLHELPVDEAKKMGAICPFGEKYGDLVRVVDIQGISKEFCGGTHVAELGEIGMVKILSEASISAGVRRIEGIVSTHAFDLFQQQYSLVGSVKKALNSQDGLAEQVNDLVKSVRSSEKEISKLRAKLVEVELESKFSNPPKLGDLNYVVQAVEGMDNKGFRGLSDTAVQKIGSGLVVLVNHVGEKVTVVCKISDDWVEKGLDASKVVAPLAELVGGRGGGRKNMAQAGGTDPGGIVKLIERAPVLIQEQMECLS